MFINKLQMNKFQYPFSSYFKRKTTTETVKSMWLTRSEFSHERLGKEGKKKKHTSLC